MQILVCHADPDNSPRLDGLVTGFLQSGHHVRLLATGGGRLSIHLRRRHLCRLSPPDLIYEFGTPANASFARRRGCSYVLDLDAMPDPMPDRADPHAARFVIASELTGQGEPGILSLADGEHPGHFLPVPFGAPVANARRSWQECAAAIIAFAVS
jgi:hypothetical protein